MSNVGKQKKFETKFELNFGKRSKKSFRYHFQMTPEERKEAIMRIHNQLGWPYQKREEEAEVEDKIDWKEKVEKATVTPEICNVVSNKIMSLEKARADRICAVFDFDAFFVNVALLKYPDAFKNKPVVICEGECKKTCCTVNYVGREYGIQKAMPFWMAQRMCQRAQEFGMPYANLQVVQKDEQKQQEISRVAVDIYREYDDTCEPSMQDEARVELGPYLLKRFGSIDMHHAILVVKEIRSRVYSATGCTVSAGIASNFAMAKMASDVKKPDNQFAVPNEDVPSFLSSMPVQKVPGIGKVKMKHLNSFGVYNVKDLKEKLPLIFTVGYHAHELLKCAIGWDDERNKPNPLPDKAQKTENFPEPLSGSALQAKFDVFCTELAKKLTVERISKKTKGWRNVNMYGKGVTMKYTTVSHLPYKYVVKSEKGKKQVSIRSATDLKKILSPYLPSKAVFNLGIYITNLEETQSNTIEFYGKRKRED